MSDLGNFPEVSHVEVKQRLYDEQRQFLRNYKTFLRKEEALRKATGDDLEEGLVSGPCAESGLSGEWPRFLLNPLGAEIKALTRPDVRTLVDATHGGVGRHIHLAMNPDRPILPDAMSILKRLKDPAAD